MPVSSQTVNIRCSSPFFSTVAPQVALKSTDVEFFIETGKLVSVDTSLNSGIAPLSDLDSDSVQSALGSFIGSLFSNDTRSSMDHIFEIYPAGSTSQFESANITVSLANGGTTVLAGVQPVNHIGNYDTCQSYAAENPSVLSDLAGFMWKQMDTNNMPGLCFNIFCTGGGGYFGMGCLVIPENNANYAGQGWVNELSNGIISYEG